MCCERPPGCDPTNKADKFPSLHGRPRHKRAGHTKHSTWKGFAYVRFGSEADMCVATGDVRFPPNSDRESRHPQNGHVRLTPESGHVQCTSPCLLWAKSRHRLIQL